MGERAISVSTPSRETICWEFGSVPEFSELRWVPDTPTCRSVLLPGPSVLKDEPSGCLREFVTPTLYLSMQQNSAYTYSTVHYTVPIQIKLPEQHLQPKDCSLYSKHFCCFSPCHFVTFMKVRTINSIVDLQFTFLSTFVDCRCIILCNQSSIVWLFRIFY